MPLPDMTYFAYKSPRNGNDVPLSLGLRTQLNLKNVTRKDPDNLCITFIALQISLLLTFKDSHLYYTGPSPAETLSGRSELVQVHRNLGHAPAGSVYSALRRAYPIETNYSDLEELEDITEQYKQCHLWAKQPNQYRALLPDNCLSDFVVAVNVRYLKQQLILHVVCRQTYFSRATSLLKQEPFTI